MFGKIKNSILLFAALLIALAAFSACGSQESDVRFTELSQLNGYDIGYVSGSVYAARIQEIFPDSRLYEYGNYTSLIEALKSGRISAYIADEPAARRHIRNTEGITAIEKMLTNDDYGFFSARMIRSFSAK